MEDEGDFTVAEGHGHPLVIIEYSSFKGFYQCWVVLTHQLKTGLSFQFGISANQSVRNEDENNHENRIEGSHWSWESLRFSPGIQSEIQIDSDILSKVRFSW